MSAVNSLLACGEKGLQLAGHGDLFTIVKCVNALNMSKTFNGILRKTAVIDPEMPLGLDTRMSMILSVLIADDWALEATDQISTGGYTFTILTRDDSASEVTVDYTLQQV